MILHKIFGGGSQPVQPRPLAPGYAVAPQIEASDMTLLAEAGFGTVICNRPDLENPPRLRSETLAQAAAAAGLRFVFNPLAPGGLSEELITRQRAAIDEAEKPVFAYCASGTRSATLWALAMAGRIPADKMIAAAAGQKYQLSELKPQIEARAKAQAGG